jgi:hypothetical protein
LTEITLYLDEDSQSDALVAALRGKGLDVLTSKESGMDGRSDVDQLSHAVSLGRTFVTRNVSDFRALHKTLMVAGGHHAGLLFVHASFSIGERVRRIERMRFALSAEDIADRDEFLSAWGEARPG